MAYQYTCPGCEMKFVINSLDSMETIYKDIHSIHNDESYDYTADILEVEDLTEPAE